MKRILCLTFVCFCVLSTGSNEINAGELKIEPHVFENSKKEKVEAEFGRLKVPENRLKKNGKEIEITFVRFKSTSKNPGSPIIYLAGGPGGSGIESARYSRFELFMAMREFGDVIALDQRGTGQSTPNLRCTERLELPLGQPLTRESLLREYASKTKECAESWEKNGVDISAYNTVESADDINDLRNAIGAKKVSLWGISYGTHLALATIRRHGKFIDKAILAGVEGVDDTLKLPSYTQNLMVELDRRLKADEELSKTVPDLLGLIRKVHNDLERQPVTVEFTDTQTNEKSKVTIGKFELQYMLSSFTGNNEAQSIFPQIYHAMSNGDYSMLAPRFASLRRSGVFSLMGIAMDCASGISAKRFAVIEKEKKETLFEDAINIPFPEVCKSLNITDLGEDFRKPVKAAIPALFISGTLDGRTPVSNAEIAIKGFKNNSHLIIEGAGHSDPLFLSTPKIKETMFKFMSGEKLPSVINTQTDEPFKFQQIENTNAQNTDSQKIDEFIKPFADANHFSGVVLAEKDGRIIFEKAYGLADVGRNTATRTDTKFGIASITKPMTSVILVKLLEAGKIKLDDKLSKYVPDFPNGEKITVEMLARHRSGIPHRVMPAEEESKRYTPAEFVEKVKQAKLEFEPGTDNLYSSAGFATLARVLEIASGENFRELLRKYVFEPTDMKNTVDFDSRKTMKNKAASYQLEAEGYTATPLKDYSFLVGAGSVFSTARDVYKFGKANVEGKFGEIVKQNFVREGVFSSNGNTNGYRAFVRINSNQKYGYVLVSNLGSGANDLILTHLRNVLEGKETTKPEVPNPAVDREVKNELKDYLGKYKLGGSSFEILDNDGELYAGQFKLLPLGKDKFYSFWSYAEITFVRDPNGKVNGLQWHGSAGKSEWTKD